MYFIAMLNWFGCSFIEYKTYITISCTVISIKGRPNLKSLQVDFSFFRPSKLCIGVAVVSYGPDKDLRSTPEPQ